MIPRGSVPQSPGRGSSVGVQRSAWIAYRTARPAPRCRLYCFPFAGGSASIFRSWSAALPPEIEVWPVQPPGREGRMREPALDSVAALVDALASELPPDPGNGLPFAFFGHSLGSLVAYELARSLRREGRPQPAQLFVSAHLAPHQPPRDEPIHALPGPDFRQALRRLNGTPEAVLEHPELMELMEPLLRADLRANETYVHRDGPPLDLPITAFGGRTDPDVSPSDLEQWSRYTTERFRSHVLPGDHFYLQHESAGSLHRQLASELFGVL